MTCERSVNNITEDIHVNADKNQIATIVRNLINNAIKFTFLKGEISINAKTKNHKVIVSISDNGVGIKPEMRETIFIPSKTSHQRGTANETGTGIGLFICKEFIENNNGEIWIESQVDKGSTFYFTIPLHEVLTA